MLFTSLTALLLFLLCAGIGALFVSSAEPLNLRQLPRHFWLGWAAALGFLQFWHCFSPVNNLSGILLAAAGIFGWWKQRRAAIAWLKFVPAWQPLLAVLALWACAAFMSNQVISGDLHIDHGLYHLQTVKWLQNYAIVPGLGNLHHRLAFNNASLLITAQLNSGVLRGYAFSLNNTLLGLALAAACLAGILNLVCQKQPSGNADRFHVLLLPFLIYHTRAVAFAGYSPDVAVFALQCALTGEFFNLTDMKDARTRDLIPLMMLGAVSVCVKISSAVFAASLVLAGLLWQLRGQSSKHAELIRSLPWAAAIFSLLILPWLVRGAVLSGYLLFPLSRFPLPLDWRMPDSMVRPVAAIITKWARFGADPPLELSLLGFLRYWISRNMVIYPRSVVYAALVTAGAAAVFLLKKQTIRHQGWVYLLICSASGLIYWFLAAPDPRFAGAGFWLLLIAALMAALEASALLFHRVSKALLYAAGMLALFAWLWPPLIRVVPAEQAVFPISEQVLAAGEVRPENTPYLNTDSNLKVYIANDFTRGACWNAPLPCTSLNDFNPALALRVEGSLQDGFLYDFSQ